MERPNIEQLLKTPVHGIDNASLAIFNLCKYVQHLETRQQVHLELIRDLSKHAISQEEAAEQRGQIAALTAEVGTLRSALREAYSKLRGTDELWSEALDAVEDREKQLVKMRKDYKILARACRIRKVDKEWEALRMLIDKALDE